MGKTLFVDLSGKDIGRLLNKVLYREHRPEVNKPLNTPPPPPSPSPRQTALCFPQALKRKQNSLVWKIRISFSYLEAELGGIFKGNLFEHGLCKESFLFSPSPPSTGGN